jgi:SOS response regulatory protein OraA/RecX
LSSESDSKKKKQKIVRYLLSKGFSFEEIMNLF